MMTMISTATTEMTAMHDAMTTHQVVEMKETGRSRRRRCSSSNSSSSVFVKWDRSRKICNDCSTTTTTTTTTYGYCCRRCARRTNRMTRKKTTKTKNKKKTKHSPKLLLLSMKNPLCRIQSVTASTILLLPLLIMMMMTLTTLRSQQPVPPSASVAAGSTGAACMVNAFVLMIPPSSSSSSERSRATRSLMYRPSPRFLARIADTRIHYHHLLLLRAQMSSDEDVGSDIKNLAENEEEEEEEDNEDEDDKDEQEYEDYDDDDDDDGTIQINLDDSTTGLASFAYYPPSEDDKIPQEAPWPSLPESTYTQVMQSMSLQTLAGRLRQQYDERFNDPRQPDNGRFCWDPWYVQVGDRLAKVKVKEESIAAAAADVDDSEQQQSQQQQQCLLPGEQDAVNSQTQYSLKRVQANNFFDETQFSDLVEALTSLGRSVGLTSITPPWMSLYTHGDQQNLHTDAPHGPLAFVFSLSLPNTFRGGETMLIQPKILDMWRDYDPSRGLELNSIFRMIPPTPLGKCLVFDPRVPHGVNVVDGTQDPRKGRVVIHGWFNSPEVCWFGPWTEIEVEQMNEMLEDAIAPLVETLGTGEIGRVVGFLACKIDISESGYVDEVRGVCDTLQADYDDFRGVVGYDSEDRPVLEDAVSDIKLTIYESLKNLYFEEGKSGRSVVVPFAFE